MQAGGSPHLENYRCQCEFLQIKAQPRLGVAGGGPTDSLPCLPGGGSTASWRFTPRKREWARLSARYLEWAQECGF